VNQNDPVTLTVIASASDGGELSYAWYKNTENSAINGSTVGGNSNNYAPVTSALGTLYYYVVVTNTKNGATAKDTSNVATVTVSATPVVNAATPSITTQPADSTVTQGISAKLTVEALSTDGGTLSYQWYSNTFAGNTNGTVIPGATADTYDTPTNLSVGNHYYYVVVTNTDTGVNGLTTASVTSSVATVTVVGAGNAIETVNADKLRVYPNPTADVVYIDNANGAAVKVYSQNGALLQSSKESRIDLSGYPNGVYLLRIGAQTVKVIKK
jgi:hypothetical protein